MRKHLLLLLASLFIFSHTINGQGWVKNFPSAGEVQSLNISQTSDGNYLVPMITEVGFPGSPAGSYLAKISPEGDLIWLEWFSTGNINSLRATESPDGGYIILIQRPNPVTGNTERYLVKLNAAVEEISSTSIVGLTNHIDPIINGNEIIVAGSGSGDTGKIKRYDLDLNLILEQDFDNGIIDLVFLPDGDLIITLSGAKVHKLNSNYDVIWETDLFADIQMSNLRAHLMDDGNIMLFSVFEPNGGAQIKLSPAGELLWIKDIFAPSGGAYIVPMDQVSVSDGFITTGTVSLIPTEPNLLLLKTDFNGDVMWLQSKHIHGGVREFCHTIIATPDDGVIGPVLFFDEENWNENSVYVFRANAAGNIFDQTLSGVVGYDQIGNCDISEADGLQNWIISVWNEETTYYTSTDSIGNYSLDVPTGIYTVTVHPPNDLWIVCENDLQVGIVADAQLTRDFPVIAEVICPAMAIQTSIPIVRPCFDNNTLYVSYCNDGTLTTNTTIDIVPDPSLTYENSTIPGVIQSPGGDEPFITFGIEGVEPGECGSFQVTFKLDCNTDIGSAVCIESNIFPNPDCGGSSNWNGSLMEANVTCESDSITFTLENNTDASMTTNRQFIIIEDALILFQEPYQLNSLQTQEIKFPANGSTYRLEAMQELTAPGADYVKVWVEGCGTNEFDEFSTGFVNQFSLGDNIPYTDTDCAEASSAYDPNDKQGFPLGYGEEHFIEENTDIEYLVRFQNTGNDTAFNVILLDTIASELDLTTIRVGAASHDFGWQIIDGNVLEFRFDDILLPDSTTNYDASNGFVEFIISQQLDLEIGNVIKNDVGIYFDFNEVVMTNETLHTIGRDFIILNTQEPVVEAARIQVFPNPFHQETTFKMQDFHVQQGNFELYDTMGKLIMQQPFSGNEFNFQRNNIPSGIYIYQIIDYASKIVNSGKLTIQ